MNSSLWLSLFIIKFTLISAIGYNWKSDLAAAISDLDIPKKADFVAVNQAGEDTILEEVTGTNIKATILQNAIMQESQSVSSRVGEPLKYRAYTKTGVPLLINGKEEYIMSNDKPTSGVTSVAIHKPSM